MLYRILIRKKVKLNIKYRYNISLVKVQLMKCTLSYFNTKHLVYRMWDLDTLIHDSLELILLCFFCKYSICQIFIMYEYYTHSSQIRGSYSMSKKKILIFISVILIIFGGVYLKMKYDEKAKQKEIYYKEQQERITLYLKYNTKNLILSNLSISQV